MSEFEIDKLFRQKLADKKIKPSDKAWEKLSAGLKKEQKGKTLLYWHAAASVVFLLGFGIYFFYSNNVDTANPVAENKPRVQRALREENPQDEKAPAEIAKKKADEDAEKRVLDEQPQKKNLALQSPQKGTFAKTELSKSLKTEPATTEKAPGNVEEIHEALPATQESRRVEEVENQTLDDNGPLLAVNDKRDNLSAENLKEYPEIKIVYKSSEKDRQDKNAILKVIELAKDVKQADIGLGTLREAKNDLLAFGFKKTKNN